MLPLRLVVLTSVLCALGAPSHATWTESGNVRIRIVGEVGGIEDAESNQIGLDTDIVDCTIGTPTEVGTLTVTQQTSAGRTDLGYWTVWNGEGYVQGVYGEGDFLVGSGTLEHSTPGVLEFLNSNVTGTGIGVRKGNLRVIAGSSVGNIHVFPLGRADVAASTTGYIQTEAGSLALVDGSISDGDRKCEWHGTLRAEESTIRCTSADIELGGEVEIGVHSFQPSELEITGILLVRETGHLSVVNTNVTTGSIDMASNPATIDVSGGTWTNGGDVLFQPGGSAAEPVAIDVDDGAQFHSLGTMSVAGGVGYQALSVRDGGTELEVDEDLVLAGNTTVSDGATVVVHGTLVVAAQTVLNIESGAIVYAMDVDADGTINQNGGQLVVPEPSAVEQSLAACGAIVAFRRRRIPRSA